MLELTLLGQVLPNSCHLLMDPLAMHQNTEWPGSEMYQSLNLHKNTKKDGQAVPYSSTKSIILTAFCVSQTLAL